MTVALMLSWREGVTAASSPEGALVVQGPSGRVSLRPVAPVLLDALRRLDPPGEDEQRLTELVGGVGNDCLPRWYYYLECLIRRGLLCYSVVAKGTRLATLVAVSSSCAARPAQAIPVRRYVLSRSPTCAARGARRSWSRLWPMPASSETTAGRRPSSGP